MRIAFALIAFLASCIGSICGIGGGIIIKPVMDAFGAYPVATVSFMSSCIVLSMSAYSVIRSAAGDSQVCPGTALFLALGAALGGIAGGSLFSLVKAACSRPDTVGAVQASALFAVTLLTLVYTLNTGRIKTYTVKSRALCAVIGLSLGVMSSFLGIGGGPVNLVVLYFFFSMEVKEAARNSLFIIFISQTANLLYLIVMGRVPDFPAALLAVMAFCGILGGMAGRWINKRIGPSTVSRLFQGLLIVIMGVCCYNFVRFL